MTYRILEVNPTPELLQLFVNEKLVAHAHLDSTAGTRWYIELGKEHGFTVANMDKARALLDWLGEQLDPKPKVLKSLSHADKTKRYLDSDGKTLRWVDSSLTWHDEHGERGRAPFIATPFTEIV